MESIIHNQCNIYKLRQAIKNEIGREIKKRMNACLLYEIDGGIKDLNFLILRDVEIIIYDFVENLLYGR